jgi:hypothetical protein
MSHRHEHEHPEADPAAENLARAVAMLAFPPELAQRLDELADLARLPFPVRPAPSDRFSTPSDLATEVATRNLGFQADRLRVTIRNFGPKRLWIGHDHTTMAPKTSTAGSRPSDAFPIEAGDVLVLDTKAPICTAVAVGDGSTEFFMLPEFSDSMGGHAVVSP